MEKHARSKSANIFSFLKSPSFSFSNLPRSPNRDAKLHKYSFNHRNAFSGPIVSIVPAEARRKETAGLSGYQTPEPTSPKVSCIGQIKQKKLKSCKPCKKPGLPPKPERRQNGLVQRMFRRRSRSRRGVDESKSNKGRQPAVPERPPAIGQMKRFTSGRDALRGFDWKEAEKKARDGVESDEDDEVFVAHSAPLVFGGGMVASEPRKEVNLWRRRPMAPPSPLQVH